jgi:hypothetical protein
MTHSILVDRGPKEKLPDVLKDTIARGGPSLRWGQLCETGMRYLGWDVPNDMAERDMISRSVSSGELNAAVVELDPASR